MSIYKPSLSKIVVALLSRARDVNLKNIRTCAIISIILTATVFVVNKCMLVGYNLY